MSEKWEKHHITVNKVTGIAAHYIDDVLKRVGVETASETIGGRISVDNDAQLTVRERHLIAESIHLQTEHTKRIGFYKKEIGFKDDKIAKLKRQVVQLLERCEAAEKPATEQWVERTWDDIEEGDLVAHRIDPFTDRVFRAEPYDPLTENGIEKSTIAKLETVIEGKKYEVETVTEGGGE